MLDVNFEGAVRTVEGFLPVLAADAAILATSSGCGTRALGLVTQEHRSLLDSETLMLEELRASLNGIVCELENNPQHEYLERIPSVGYSLSKLALNSYVRMLARQLPAMQVNACSPGAAHDMM